MKSAVHRLLLPLLHLYWRVSRGVTLGVRTVAFDAAGRVALVRHTYVAGWHLPGGGVEPGETAEAAARRELAEEAGIKAGSFALHGIFLNAGPLRRDHVLVFVARDAAATSPRRADGEIAESGFFALDTLPAETTAATRARLAEVVRGRAATPFWQDVAR